MTIWSMAQVIVPATVQNGSNLRRKAFAITADSIRLDTTSIIPQTFIIEGIPSSDYRLDFINALLYWNKRPAADSINVTYRVFFYKLNPVAQRMHTDSVINKMAIAPYEFNNEPVLDRKSVV